MKRLSAICASVLVMAGATATQAATVVVDVVGKSNPYLAGKPDGYACCSDMAPNASPLLALTNFDTSEVITFSAIGGFSLGGGTPAASADGSGGNANLANYPATGIAGADGVRYNALVGVFLDASGPVAGSPPARFASGQQDAATISPLLNQIFWIGDGLTGTGTGDVQQFFAPTGATRLYLGSTDGYGWFNNTGVSEVTINYTALSTGAIPEPATWAMMIVGFGGAGAVIRRRRSQSAALALNT